MDRGTVEPGDLHGDRDVSLPVCSIDAYRGTDRVPVHGYPHRLRRGGWVYLRLQGCLHARLRAAGVAWVDDRSPRAESHSDRSVSDIGPGLVVLVDPDTWEDLAIDLGARAHRQRSGIRYLRADRSGGVTHLRAGEPLPTGRWDD